MATSTPSALPRRGLYDIDRASVQIPAAQLLGAGAAKKKEPLTLKNDAGISRQGGQNFVVLQRQQHVDEDEDEDDQLLCYSRSVKRGGVLEKRRFGGGGGMDGVVRGGGGGGADLDRDLKKVKVDGDEMDVGGVGIRKREVEGDDEDEDDIPLAQRISYSGGVKKVVGGGGGVKCGTPNSTDKALLSVKKAVDVRKKAKAEDGLVNRGLHSSAGNGVSSLTFAASRPSSSKDVPMKGVNHVSGEGAKMRPKILVKQGTDSEDSDDDKPLVHRRIVKAPVKVETAPVEIKDGGKKRSLNQIASISSPLPAVKKIKVSLQSPRPTPPQSEKHMQSSKSSLLSPKTPASAKQADPDDDDEDNVPLAQRLSSLASKKVEPWKITNTAASTNAKADRDHDDDADDHMTLAKRSYSTVSVPQKTTSVTVKKSPSSSGKSITKKVLEARRKGKKTVQVTKRKVLQKGGKSGKNDKVDTGGGEAKWTTLEHNGVIFPPPYQQHRVKLLYDGKAVDLTPEQEEVATMFAVMKDTDYASKPKFIANFWNDWKPILGSGHVIKKIDLCDFTPIYNWHMAEKEKKKSMSAEEKKKRKEEKSNLEEKYMWALVNGVREKVGNFRVEPPGLFRGRGEHPKMGKLKRRIYPEDIVINVGKGASVPECPIPGRRWKEVRHDNTVTWLAYWNDPINTKESKYVFLAASSSLKGQSDKEKYEKARMLKDYIQDIRKTYTKNFGSSDPTKRQIAVATYLIDRLALRAGNDKDDDEADTVGCCSLKIEHVALVPPKALQETEFRLQQFDFLGKDSIRYFNKVDVDERVYKAIGDFKKSKKVGDDLFDRLDTNKLNAHLKEIMPSLTAKVFRTYNASITLDSLLQSTSGSNVAEKVADYHGANKEVAILCNHQRSVSKSHSAQMEKLTAKMEELESLLDELQTDLDRARKGKPPLKDSDGKPKRNQSPESLEKKITQTTQKIEKMKLDMKVKDDLKTVALGTSKINYLDPRITVAWCKLHEVPIEKIFNKSLLAKFAWAMDVEPEFRF